MVGIPGKSKGCHTCRRRKIKCDLEEPNCARCRQSGRVCEGYKRGAVFLNRTAQGLEKRKRLEEAQPRQEPSPGSDSPQSDTTIPVIEKDPDRNTDVKLLSVALYLNPASVMKKKFQSLFLESYLPAKPNDGPGLYREWLCAAVTLNDPGKVLEYSLHALCITRAGRLAHDQALTVQGNAAYGFALRELQKALLSPRLAIRDETLAACYLLSIYELFESTSQSISGHENHLLGVERLVKFRGPRQHDSPMGRALLKNICYSSMVKCIQYRKPSILKEMIDQIEWQQFDLKLFSKGHTLGGLLQDIDLYTASSGANISIRGSMQRLGQFLTLDTELQIWYQQLLSESPSPPYWRSKINGKDQGKYSFASLELAHLMLDYWALRLIISVTVAKILQGMPDRLHSTKDEVRNPAKSSRSDPDKIPVQVGSAYNFVEQAEADHGGGIRAMELAVTIMESLPYCMGDENGISSSQKCLFAAQAALFLLLRRPSEKLASYEALCKDLVVNKGFNFANRVGQTLQRWESQV